MACAIQLNLAPVYRSLKKIAMKRRYRILIFCLQITIGIATYGQQTADTSIRMIAGKTPREKEFVTENLFLLGKVWGFLKYYHPAIAAGNYKWDKELIKFLPGYCKTRSVKERNDSLEAWLSRFGTVPVCTSCNDSVLQKARLQPDFSWINETNFSPSLVRQLKHIRDNRIQQGLYYVKLQSMDGITVVQFQHEDVYSGLVYPNDSYGLLSLFRIWNSIEYWYPYKYNLPVSWNDVLKQFIPRFLDHKDAYDYTRAVQGLIVALKDGHGYFRGAKTEEMAGNYCMPFTVRLVEDQLFVTSVLNDSLAARSNVRKGDIITKIGGSDIHQWIKKLSPWVPASNTGYLHRALSYRLTKTTDTASRLTIKRNGKIIQTSTINYIPKSYPAPDLDPPYFSHQQDTAFCLLPGSIGYINTGRFKRNDSLALGAMIKKAKSLVIDCRQNQDESKGTGGGDIIANFLLPQDSQFVKFSSVEPTYPGVFSFSSPTNMGLSAQEDRYTGQVIILIDEGTISVGEFLAMAYQKIPGAKTMGSTTAGADGNITYAVLPGAMMVVFTGLGVYYPDGSETQRVGIRPDIRVQPTIKGYTKGEDEQLLKALDYLRTGR